MSPPLPMPHNPAKTTSILSDFMLQNLTEEERIPYKRAFVLIDKATKVKRSPFRTSVMLLGDSGVGKSSTVNHLLNSEVASVHHSRSQTSAVTPYISGVRLNQLNIDDLQLRVVDTPGFNDTNGIDQDACNLWAIRKYCEENCTSTSIFYENIILFCVNTMDNRYEGEESKFSKTLNVLKELKVTDKYNNNVLIVMTHACSAGHFDPQSWKRDINKKAKDLGNLAKKSLGVEFVPVVYLENNFKKHGLQTSRGGFESILPDGIKQPANLFQAMMKLLQKNHDELAYVTMREFYGQSLEVKHKFAKGVEFQAKKVSATTILNEQEKECREGLLKVSQWRKVREEIQKSEREKQAESMKIEKELQKAKAEFIKLERENQKKAADARKRNGPASKIHEKVTTVETTKAVAVPDERRQEADRMPLPELDKTPSELVLLGVLASVGAAVSLGVGACGIVLVPVGVGAPILVGAAAAGVACAGKAAAYFKQAMEGDRCK